ncbi:Uncharacterised protein [Vibrio cholerae]|uniref:Uncharacterized protein n=1 Tax=Vibrio cholerae TaxID=666 RepID=A0A655YCM3_VIBCL|nr:Uncharacterised protein [Vibrio cholerae]CSC36756.1 Uncharacterised protein [Vibrio cholerae]
MHSLPHQRHYIALTELIQLTEIRQHIINRLHDINAVRSA